MSIERINNDILLNREVVELMSNKIREKKIKYQPRSENFLELPEYNKEEILEEQKRVSQYKKSWEHEETPESRHNKNLSEIVEHVVVDQFSGEWLGNKAVGHYTAEEDDVLRGVDVVAEFNGEDESHYLGFALDVTLARDPIVLDGKLSRIWQNDIKKGHRAEVKYLETDNFKGSTELFRVVVGINKDFARELINLQRFSDKSENKERLQKHRFQAHLIAQIKYQLESYLMYARYTKNHSLKEQVKKSLEVFYGVYSDKENMIKELQDEIEDEPDFRRIADFCQTELKTAERYFS